MITMNLYLVPLEICQVNNQKTNQKAVETNLDQAIKKVKFLNRTTMIAHSHLMKRNLDIDQLIKNLRWNMMNKWTSSKMNAKLWR